MKRFIFVVLALNLLLLSCEVRFDPDVRIQVTGNLISDDNEAISDAEIGIYTRTTTGGSIFAPGPTGSDEFLLGRNYSIQDGSFEVISLYDRDSDFSIIISNENKNTNYIYATSTVNYTPEDLTFHLETVTLPRLSTINYDFSRTSGDESSLQFNFNFKDITCYEYFIEGVLDAGLSRCYEDRFINRTLNDNNPDLNGVFSAPYGTDVEFSYSINNQDPIIETFTINQDNYEFTINY